MRTTSMWAIGVIAMMVTIGVGNAPGSFAADLNRGDVVEPRIGHGGTYSSSQSDGAVECRVAGRHVDVIERVGAGGSIYSFSQPPSAQTLDCQVAGRKADVVQRIGHGGSIYTSSRPNAQIVGR